ncbi:MAG: hypothetical protein KIT22_13810 [Verrucomicrobiae bacterium]|nr:hypothetical protein [Verrucomicrobiae bacterium]
MGVASGCINLFFAGAKLLLALALALPLAAADAGGTNTAEPKRASSRLGAIKLHIETTDDGNGPRAEVIRSQPQTIPIQKAPFFDERDVALAEMVETPDGGFMIQIDSTEHGRNALEMTTVSANGRRIVIYGQWTTDDKVTGGRWMAAPLIRTPIRNGSLRFSVDCDREEARMWVDGLNNVAVKLKNQSKGKQSSTKNQQGSPKKNPVNSTSTAGDLINKYSRP